jgi:hypothetical protein
LESCKENIVFSWVTAAAAFAIFQNSEGCGLSTSILAKAAPVMFLTLCSGSAGEMIGYARGPGKARVDFMRFECERHSLITKQDLEAASQSFLSFQRTTL